MGRGDTGGQNTVEEQFEQSSYVYLGTQSTALNLNSQNLQYVHLKVYLYKG